MNCNHQYMKSIYSCCLKAYSFYPQGGDNLVVTSNGLTLPSLVDESFQDILVWCLHFFRPIRLKAEQKMLLKTYFGSSKQSAKHQSNKLIKCVAFKHQNH